MGTVLNRAFQALNRQLTSQHHRSSRRMELVRIDPSPFQGGGQT